MKRTILNSLLTAFAVATFSWLNPAFAQPVNDLCADAIPITCGSNTAGTTVGAGEDDVAGGPAFFCGTAVTSPGVWYSIIGDDSMITVSTCGVQHLIRKYLFSMAHVNFLIV